MSFVRFNQIVENNKKLIKILLAILAIIFLVLFVVASLMGPYIDMSWW
jgi:hypothetical protein